MTSHIFSQSLTISPWNPVYVQLNGTYAFDELDTPATRVSGASANMVTESRNGYWNASALVGLTLNDRTDLQAQYSYYQSDNYINNSLVSTAYGDEASEHGVTVTLNRMLTRRLRLTLKYGYFDYSDTTSGGHNNYTAHMVYSSLQYRF
jgi:predicted porin